jgi:hypothetical protein
MRTFHCFQKEDKIVDNCFIQIHPVSRKPEAVLHYNKTKSHVDMANWMTQVCQKHANAFTFKSLFKI